MPTLVEEVIGSLLARIMFSWTDEEHKNQFKTFLIELGIEELLREEARIVDQGIWNREELDEELDELGRKWRELLEKFRYKVKAYENGRKITDFTRLQWWGFND